MDNQAGTTTQAQRGIWQQGNGKRAGGSQTRQVLEATGMLGGIDILGESQCMAGDDLSYSLSVTETKMTV